jgi:hypothetical protein
VSTIQPPPASPTGIQATGPIVLPVITLSKATAELLQLPVGTQTSAQVVAAALRGSAEIETPFGRFTVETPLNLKAEQPLLLQIAPKTAGGGTTLLLHVLEIAGKPAPGAQSLPGVPSLAGNAAGVGVGVGDLTQAPIGPTTLTLSVGSTVGATLLTSSPVFTISPDGGFNLSQPAPGTAAGSVLPGVAPSTGLLPGQVRPSGIVQNPALSLQDGAQHLTAATPQSSTQQASQPGSTIQHPAGSNLTLSIQSMTPPTPGASTAILSPGTATPFMAGQSITGIVTGTTASGHTVVHTPTASVSVGTAQSLPPGTQISFRVETAPQAPTGAHIMPPSLHRESMMVSQAWPSLDEGLAVLQEVSPATANQITNQIIPKLNVQFTATALFFLSALRSGDVRSWIGDSAAKILERAKPDAMKRLGDDFRAMGAVDEDGGGPVRTMDWRGTLVPFQSPDGLEQIRLYTKQLNDEDDDQDERITGNRFLIDVTLSNMGRLQLDGMIEKQDKRLDLIVRTSQPLPPLVRNDMMELFSKSNEIVGMRGGMSFQAAPDAFVEMESENRAADSGVGIVV